MKILGGEAGKQETLQQMFRNSRSQIIFRTDIFQKLSLGAHEGFAFLSVGAVFTDIVKKVFFSLSPTSQAQLTRNAADNIVRETAYFIKYTWGLSQKLTRYMTIYFQVAESLLCVNMWFVVSAQELSETCEHGLNE